MVSIQSFFNFTIAYSLFWVGGYYVYLAFRAHHGRIYATFSLLCFSLVIYDLCSILTDNFTQDALGTVLLTCIQTFVLFLALNALFWITLAITEKKVTPSDYLFSSLLFLFGGLALALPQGAIWGFPVLRSEIAVAKLFSVVYYEASASNLLILLYAVGALSLLFCLYMLIKKAHAEGYQNYAAALGAYSILLLTLLNDSAVYFGLYAFPYLKELGFLALVVLMAKVFTNELLKAQQLRRELNESDRRYRTLIEHIDMGISLINSAYEIELSNDSLSRIFATEGKTIHGKKCYEVLGKQGAVCSYCPGKRAMESGVPQQADVSALREDGGALDIHINAFPILEEGGGVTGFIEVVSDISQEKQAQRTIQRQEEFERMMSAISTRFISLRLEELHEGLHEALAEVAEFIGAERAYLSRFSSDLSRVTCIGQWAKDGSRLPSHLQTAAVSGMPEWLARMERLEPSVLNSLDEIASPSDQRLTIYEEIGLRSGVTLPIAFDGKLIAFWGVGSVSDDRLWTQSDIAFLRIFGETIAHILQRHQMEEALRASEKRLASVIENAPAMLFAIDHEGLVTCSEGRGLKALGIESGALVGENIFAKYIGCSRLIKDGHRVLRGETFTSILRHKGFTFENHYAPVLSAEGEILGALGVFVDISERMQAETERRQLYTAIEHAAENVILMDTQGLITYVNPSFERAMGYSRAEVCGKRPLEFCKAIYSRAFFVDMWDQLNQGEVWGGALIHTTKAGEDIEYDVNIAPIREATGKISGYVCLQRDITEQVRLEGELRHSQKMEAVGQLAGGVAHDFNNLLQAIQGYADLALSKTDQEDSRYANLKEVMQAGERAVTLVRQLLMFSRREKSEPRPVNLNDVILNIAKMLTRILGEHIDLRVHTDNSLHLIEADPSQIEQILLNLCVNARDAIAESGTITIETHNSQLNAAYRARYPEVKEGHYVLLRVSDDGEGIPSEIQDRIYDPFFTTKEVGAGTGLGLATVYGIVKRHEGFIHLESRPQQGTIFSLHFPIVEGKVAQEEHGDPAAVVKGGHETILLAEDDEIVRTLSLEVLQDGGYRVFLASDGLEAMKVFEAHQEEIDLAILDVVMPHRHGRKVYEHFREKRPELPILFCSGYIEDRFDISDLLNEQVRLLRKPYIITTLLQEVRDILG